MIGFPTGVLLSEEGGYVYLKRSLHPEGLSAEGYALPDGQAPHDCRRTSVTGYRCRECGAVFKRLPRYGVVEDPLRSVGNP